MTHNLSSLTRRWYNFVPSATTLPGYLSPEPKFYRLKSSSQEDLSRLPWKPCEEFDNSLLYWYPKIRNKVPTPRTITVPLTRDWLSFVEPEEELSQENERWLVRCHRAASKIGYPLFLRTDISSAKHQWRDTCHVPDKKALASHIQFLLEEAENAGFNNAVGIAEKHPEFKGNPHASNYPRALCFREFLSLRTFFTAYRDMPVAREFRFFVIAGEIQCWHPYWPHKALEEGHPSREDWRSLLPELEREDGLPFEVVKAASKPFNELISVDVCQTVEDSWYVTDLACGYQSAHWKHGEA